MTHRKGNFPSAAHSCRSAILATWTTCSVAAVKTYTVTAPPVPILSPVELERFGNL